jgi:ribonuclease P protein component
LIDGISRRQTFDRLRREGTRVRSRRLALTFVPNDDGRHQVAFAISRKVGGAVVRNRCRRRIRPLLAARAAAGQLRPGGYLVQVSVRVDAVPADELAFEVDELLASLDARLDSRAGAGRGDRA